MCIIAAVPQGIILDDATLDHCWDSNPHGGGFAFVDSGNRTQIMKFLDKAEFMEKYRSFARAYSEQSPFIVHFRIKTHGEINIENAHPFRVDRNLVFAHNGIIQITIPKKYAALSDTAYFNESILKNLPKGWHDNPAQCELIGRYIGHSKLAFLTQDRRIIIFNKRLGEIRKSDGVWFSNGGYEPYIYEQHQGRFDWASYRARERKHVSQLTTADWDAMEDYEWKRRQKEFQEWEAKVTTNGAKDDEQAKVANRGSVMTKYCESCGDEYAGSYSFHYWAAKNEMVCQDCHVAYQQHEEYKRRESLADSIKTSLVEAENKESLDVKPFLLSSEEMAEIIQDIGLPKEVETAVLSNAGRASAET